MWEAREGPTEIAGMKAVMGKWKYAAQYQQDPIPEGGAIFQREWFNYGFPVDPGTGLPLGAKLRMIIQSWDTAAKKKESNDFWACTTWGLVPTNSEPNIPSTAARFCKAIGIAPAGRNHLS